MVEIDRQLPKPLSGQRPLDLFHIHTADSLVTARFGHTKVQYAPPLLALLRSWLSIGAEK
jgi:hypothetical protein